MRILFAQKLPYLPALNGASRIGRSLLEALAERNHQCRVVALTGTSAAALQPSENGNPKDRNAPTAPTSGQVFFHNGVSVYTFPSAARLHERLNEQFRQFDPDWIVVSEDPTYMLLAAATKLDPRRTLFLSQSQATLPFGPEAFVADRSKRRILEEVAGILTSSRYLESYIRRWGGLESFVTAVPVYGAPPFARLGSFDNPYVTIINPSDIKGLAIFLELARRFREVKFAAVPTWATTAVDRSALAALPNVTLLPPSENIDDIFSQTRVLLVPSLWGEAFGLVVVEAMLRGIPVLASDAGGLPEAKLGVDYLFPVRRIETYQERRDDNGIPVPVIPDQDVEPWEIALRKTLSDRGEFDRLSAQSRRAAHDYAAGLSILPTERYLEDLLRRRPAFIVAPQKQKDDLAKRLDALPAEKLAALASRLKKEDQRN